MKSRILSIVLIVLFATACNGTFEVGLEHSPADPASATTLPIVVPLPTTLSIMPASPSPQPSPTLEVRTATPVGTGSPTVYTLQIFLIAVEDNGKSGPLVGCGDSVVPVQVEIPPTQAVLKAALEKMLSLKDQYYGQSGLYNALYQSSLKVDRIGIDSSGKASVYLTGTLKLGGECDNPRVQAQLEKTVLQFATVTEADIFINDKPLADALSLK